MEKIKPVTGAAEYLAVSHKGAWAVAMYPPDDPEEGSVIQTCRTFEAAFNAAAKWQKKENKVVLSNPQSYMKDQLNELLANELYNKGLKPVEVWRYRDEILTMLRGAAWENIQTMRDELNDLSVVLGKVANQLK